ncbi:hypothetical protein [Litchfieldia alkalitelluris]|uniref:hypothetical protein n=1 Tax=Litchfieldia alkalitelluris TaxID=304268 RepID=UPI00195A4365|nr:hypothetical protein [Litchfieldia alkalitelluris]
MLISLNILFIVCTFILPNYMLIKGERKNIEQINQAQALLSEELEHVYFGEKEMETTSIYEKETLFTIEWNYNESFGLFEGCIKWEDSFKREKKRCGYSKGS